MPDPTASALAAFSIPQTTLRELYGIGRNLLNRLEREGEIDSLIVGARIRHVVVQSWLDYLHRQVDGGLPRDPGEKRRAAEAYKLSVAKSTGAKATKLARSAWGPDHGKRGGSKHLASKRATAARKASPPPPVSPKTKPSKRRSVRKETSTTM